MTDHHCPHHAHPHAHARWLPRMDALGSTAAFICAVHCAFLPMAAVVLPLTTVELLGGHEIERFFVVFAALFGAVVLSSGLSRASRIPVSLLFANALLFLSLGVLTHASPVMHAVLMVVGGLSLGSAHALNRHSVRSNDDALVLWRRTPTSAAAPLVTRKAID